MSNKTMHLVADGALIAGSALAGGMAGHVLGKPSLGAGLAAIAGGLYLEKKYASKPYGKMLLFSAAGMIAHNADEAAPVSGMEGIDGLADAREKAISYLKSIGRRAYVDKLSPHLASKLGLGDLGEVSYYTGGDISNGDVNSIINDIAAKNSVAGLGSASDSGELMGADAGELLNGSSDITELSALSAIY